MRRLLPMSAAVLVAAAVTSLLAPRIALASAPSSAFDQVADVWMSTIALLEHDEEDEEEEEEDEKGRRESDGMKRRGDHRREHGRGGEGGRCECEGGTCEKCRGGHEGGGRCGCGKDGCERCQRGERHGHPGRGGHPHGGHGHGDHGARPGMEGPRALMAKMDEIMARLGRIEAKLDGRPGAPMRGEWRGPRPEGPRPEGPRPERPAVPEEVREQMRKRMEQGREQMEQARQKFRQMEERIRKLEAEVERLKADR